jgi:hypothetical protein
VSKSCLWDENFNDVEAMVRAAGHYVAASDKLRPRVLEAARMETSEQRSRQHLRRVTLFALLLVLFTTGFRQVWDDGQTAAAGNSASADYYDAISPVSATTTRNGDGDWRIIDAFIKLRQAQAQLLRAEI